MTLKEDFLDLEANVALNARPFIIPDRPLNNPMSPDISQDFLDNLVNIPGANQNRVPIGWLSSLLFEGTQESTPSYLGPPYITPVQSFESDYQDKKIQVNLYAPSDSSKYWTVSIGKLPSGESNWSFITIDGGFSEQESFHILEWNRTLTRTLAFSKQICQNENDCPINNNWIQLIKWDSLSSNVRTTASTILNPFSNPNHTHLFSCIKNINYIKPWAGYYEKDYSDYTAPCWKIKNGNINVNEPANVSLFNYQELKNNVVQHLKDGEYKYESIEEAIIGFWHIGTPYRDSVRNNARNLWPAFPSESITGNYYILAAEPLTTDQSDIFSNLPDEEKASYMPYNQILAVKDNMVIIDEWKKEIAEKSAVDFQTVQEWCNETTPSRCLHLTQEIIEEWQRIRVPIINPNIPPDEAEYEIQSKHPTNLAHQATLKQRFYMYKMGDLIPDYLGLGSEETTNFLLVRTCSYRYRKQSVTGWDITRALYDPEFEGETAQNLNHLGYHDLTTKILEKTDLSSSKRSQYAYQIGYLECGSSLKELENIANQRYNIDRKEARREMLATWVHSIEAMYAFIALMPVVENVVGLFLAPFGETIGPVIATAFRTGLEYKMTTDFVNDSLRNLDEAKQCKKENGHRAPECAVKANEAAANIILMALPMAYEIGTSAFRDYFGKLVSKAAEEEPGNSPLSDELMSEEEPTINGCKGKENCLINDTLEDATSCPFIP